MCKHVIEQDTPETPFLVVKKHIQIGPAVRADFRRLYPANAKTPTCCPSDDNRTKVTNSVTSARSLWWHVGPYFWPADLTRTANPILNLYMDCLTDNYGTACNRCSKIVYVGETGTRLHMAGSFVKHQQKSKWGTNCGTFTRKGHNLMDMKITGIEKVKKRSTI